MSEPTTDPAILALPHPIRLDLAVGGAFDVELLQTAGVHGHIWPIFQKGEMTTEWIINSEPGLQQLALSYCAASGPGAMGSLFLLLTRARLRAQCDPIVRVSPQLQAHLFATDIQDGLPARE